MTSRRPNPYIETLMLTAIAVGVMLIATRPDIRQALSMRLALAAHRFCRAQADFWTHAAGATATAYQRARL